MHTAYLLTGANMGDPAANLATARDLIEAQCGQVINASSLYSTAAWGQEDQPAFLNQAIQLETELSARQLMRKLLKIEKQMGRVRKEKYGPRIIDIDIIFFDQEIHNYDLLKLPHPEMANRRFVLAPLAEIASNFVHPALHKTVSVLLNECPDPLPVSKIV